jgi:ABC-type glycerol-3-phosphate transport system permease component
MATVQSSIPLVKAKITKKGNTGAIITRAVVYGILILGCLFTLVPFLWMISTSFKTATEIIQLPPTFVPEHFTVQSYNNIFNDPHVPLARFYMNSIIVSLAIVFIDGSSEFGIYARIILPQMGAALATLGIFQFMGTWNDYLWPLIVITSTEKRTLPIMLSWYSTQHGTRYDLTMAASILVIIPVLIAYFIFQRWVVRGIALTGFK